MIRCALFNVIFNVMKKTNINEIMYFSSLEQAQVCSVM